MKRADYKNNVWYPLTDDEYWVDYWYVAEFPNCQTIVTESQKLSGVPHKIMTYDTCPIGWSTMAKAGTYFFMIIEKP
jgi:hypothetical protein